MKTSRGQKMRVLWQPGRAAVAGLGATAAYSLVMEADMALTGNRSHDVRFIQGMLEVVWPQNRALPWLAWGLHFLNGALLAEGYALVCKRFLPGPAWLKGAMFGELFVASVWGLTPLVDRYHPLSRRGELAKLATWTSFWQNIVRHGIFGVVMGWMYGDGDASLGRRAVSEAVEQNEVLLGR